MSERYSGLNLPPCADVLGAIALQIIDPALLSNTELALDHLPVLGEVAAIRQEAARLRTSTDPRDIETVDLINWQFGLADRPVPRRFGPRAGLMEDVVGWLAAADAEVILDFVRWNERSLRAQQAKVRERTAHLQPFIRPDVQQLVEDTVLRPHVAQLMEQSIEAHTEPGLMDAFTSSQRRARASYDLVSRHTKYSENVVDDKDLYFTTVHEHFHGASNEAGSPLFDLYEEDGEDYHPSWLIEAVTDMVTIAAVYRDIDTECIRYTLGRYSTEMELLESLMQYGPELIEPSEIIDANFEPKSTPGRPLWNSLKKKLATLDALFPELPKGLIRTISYEYNQARTAKEAEAIGLKWLVEFGRRAPEPYGVANLTDEENTLRSIVFVGLLPEDDQDLLWAS